MQPSRCTIGNRPSAQIPVESKPMPLEPLNSKKRMNDDLLAYQSALDLSDQLDRHQISAEALMRASLARIDACNGAVNAIVSRRDPDLLLAEARARDSAWSAGAKRLSWLDGLPMAIKDLCNTAGLATTFGSPLFADHVPNFDDVMVARLRAAGAIFIGKTNVPEFGLGSQTYNPVFGATACAFDTALTSGGSSGGAAAALAAGMVAIADGSDMMGSLRNPAAYNNIFGLRPTLGRVPQLPSANVFHSEISTCGPMARNTADLAALLAVQSGFDARAPQSITDDPAQLAKRPFGAAAGMRIAWLGDWAGHFPMEEGILELGKQAMRRFEAAGVAVDEITPRFDPAQLWSAWLVLRQVAVAGRFEALYRDTGKRRLLKPEACWEIESGLQRSALDFYRAQTVRSSWFTELARLHRSYDALVLPSAQTFAFDKRIHWPAQIAGRQMDTYHRWMEIVVPGSLSAGPTMSVPAGFDAAGRAMGMQLLAAPRAERTLFALASGYEKQIGDLLARHPQIP